MICDLNSQQLYLNPLGGGFLDSPVLILHLTSSDYDESTDFRVILREAEVLRHSVSGLQLILRLSMPVEVLGLQ